MGGKDWQLAYKSEHLTAICYQSQAGAANQYLNLTDMDLVLLLTVIQTLVLVILILVLVLPGVPPLFNRAHLSYPIQETEPPWLQGGAVCHAVRHANDVRMDARVAQETLAQRNLHTAQVIGWSKFYTIQY